jgi:hypothetical protein
MSLQGIGAGIAKGLAAVVLNPDPFEIRRIKKAESFRPVPLPIQRSGR